MDQNINKNEEIIMQKEKSKIESYAEKWFKEHGFEFKILKQYLSKTNYEVTKDGVTDTFELSSSVTDGKLYMDNYGKSFAMKVEIDRMKAQLNKKSCK